MTLTVSLLIDVLIVGFLFIFVYRGVKRGLIMTFFSLLAVLIALSAGWFLSSHYADALAAQFQPSIEERISESIVENDVVADSDTLMNMGYSKSFASAIQSSLAGETAASLGSSISGFAARSAMFLVGFFVVMAIWLALSHFLDLVTRFPGLHGVDRALGGIMGLFLGYVFLLLIYWVLCDLLAAVPQTLLEGSYLVPLLNSRPFFFLVSP